MQNTFTIHTMDSAPEKSKDVMQQLQTQVGFVPNLAATMAESPNLIQAFVQLRSINGQASLSPVEREAIALAVSFENQCSYCMAAHSTFAKMNGASDEDLSALRSGKSPRDFRLAALVTFATQMLRARGQVPANAVNRLLEAGFSRA